MLPTNPPTIPLPPMLGSSFGTAVVRLVVGIIGKPPMKHAKGQQENQHYIQLEVKIEGALRKCINYLKETIQIPSYKIKHSIGISRLLFYQIHHRINVNWYVNL